MLTGRLTDSRAELGRESGFTLVEMLVVLLAGTVIMAALFTILDVTLTESSRTFSKVDATSNARTGLATMESEMESACVAPGFPPIEGGSTSTALNFISAYGTQPTPTPVWHVITTSNGSLTDTKYVATEGNDSSGNNIYTQGAQLAATSDTGPNPQVLVANVKSVTFQYFKYQQIPNGSGGYYSDPAGNPYELLPDGTNPVPGTSVIPSASQYALSTPLSTSDSEATSEVTIALTVGPSVKNGEVGSGENSNLPDVNATVNDSFVMRMTPVADHAGTGTVFAPCE
jgi:prepilin-type N-terminal cleavage/methylation domain-containing protein